MGDKSGIEWTDATWNPVTGCTQVSPGCSRCYISRTPPFRKEGRRFTYEGKQEGVTTGVRLHPDRLEQPLKWRKPRRVFVNSLSDLFHEDVPDEFIHQVWAAMSMCPQHIFQVLTKRPERMHKMLADEDRFEAAVEHEASLLFACDNDPPMRDCLSHIWLGVSAENQHWADGRIPLLLKTPAAVRFVSCEPLLGPVDLRAYLDDPFSAGTTHTDHRGVERYDLGGTPCDPIDWVIAGGESGPNARPSHPDWFRQLRDQCQDAGVSFFFKQWGEWRPLFNEPLPKVWKPVGRDGRYGTYAPDYRLMGRFGKKAAGALLDGREWREFPV